MMTAAGPLLGEVSVLPLIAPSSVRGGVEAVDRIAAAGLGGVEIALRTPSALEVISEVAHLRPELVIAAGTVRSVRDAAQSVDAGATLLISPMLDLQVGIEADRLDTAWIPGVATASELHAALANGRDVAKLFPIHELGGLSFAKALSGPYPEARFLVSGGVTVDDVATFLQLPAIVAVSGGWLGVVEDNSDALDLLAKAQRA